MGMEKSRREEEEWKHGAERGGRSWLRDEYRAMGLGGSRAKQSRQAKAFPASISERRSNSNTGRLQQCRRNTVAREG